ncbi:hypothetical protein ADL21_24175 [Streptomyces albus subsp. albus]|nr:hypothetical protein ADL21_24175 [Streptomyces albus subsp. albus]
MPGDELHETNAAAPGARTGPRHAAPRKPLLTRLHVPAGKAIAIAAMPSAVLMGMGLTPQLAMAKPQPPESPFRNGPCVSAPDKAEQDAKDKAAKDKAAKEKTEKEKAAKDKAAKEKAAEDGKSAKPGKDEAAGGTGTTPAPTPDTSSRTPSPSPDRAGKAPAPTPSPSASSPSSEQNPWYDPLGVGKKLHDVFHPGQDEPAGPGATPSPSPSGSSGTGKPADHPSTKPTDPLKDAVGKAGEAAGDATGKSGKAAKDAAKDAKDKADGASPSASPSPSGSAGPGVPDADGKKPFPCVEEKKVAGTDERPPATVPNQPWYLESSGLTLRGLDYEGVVNLTMPNGRTKQALKFTADSIDIGDLHQIVDGPAGKKYHVQAAAGSTSTIRGGQVTMYTERLQGNLFGLIPIVFDPEHPPPLNVPFAYFTKVKITQAGQFGGTLTIPGLHQSVTD